MIKRITTTALAVAALLFGAADKARAGPLYSINFGTFSGGTAQLHAPGTLANNLTVELGSVLITGALGTFESYCVDLNHYMNEHSTVTTAVNTMQSWNQGSATSPSNASGRASWLYLTYGPQAANSVDRAALSLAIWNSLYDTDFDVTAGTGFWETGASNANYVTRANSMLADLQAYQLSTGSLPQAIWLQTTDANLNYTQDFIATVPEPGTLTLMAVGLVSATVARRRKKAVGGS